MENVTQETKWNDLKIMRNALACVLQAKELIASMTEPPIDEIMSGLKQLDDELSESIISKEEEIDEMNTAPMVKKMLATFRAVDVDCMRNGADSIPFSDTEYYAEQIAVLFDVPITQADYLANLLNKFDIFKQTGKDVDDISRYSDDHESHTPGRVYLDDGINCGLVMESTKNWEPQYKKGGAWYLVIGNQQWQSDDLEELELELFDFAVSAGWMDDPEVETPDCSPAGEPC